MSLKTILTWSIRVIPAVVFFVSFYHNNSFARNAWTLKPSSNRALCARGLVSKKERELDFNISRTTGLFLKLEDFFWNQHPSALRLPYGTNGSELFLLRALAATAGYEMPESIANLDCRTCVVVGNGFALKNISLGHIINQYDLVIRLNDAPVSGYENDVGNKTTMRLFYPESAFHNPSIHNSPDTLMVLVPFKLNDLRWLNEILYNEKRVRKGFWRNPPQIWLGESKQIRILDPFLVQQTANKLLKMSLPPKPSRNSAHPTTGIIAIYVALSYCDVVHVAGFGYPPSTKDKHPIHYYGQAMMKAMKNSFHDLSSEAKALKRLEDAGSIQYLHAHA